MSWPAPRIGRSMLRCSDFVVGTRIWPPISPRRPIARLGGRSDRFRGGSKFSTWLYRIAYNTFLNHIRRPKLMEPLTEERADRLLDPGRTAQEETFLSLEARRLRAAILDLPDELRFAVTARFWAELPLAEIAQLQGISTVGVRKRLQRAYGQLAAALEGETQ